MEIADRILQPGLKFGPQKTTKATDLFGLKFDTQTEGLCTYTFGVHFW